MKYLDGIKLHIMKDQLYNGPIVAVDIKGQFYVLDPSSAWYVSSTSGTSNG